MPFVALFVARQRVLPLPEYRCALRLEELTTSGDNGFATRTAQ